MNLTLSLLLLAPGAEPLFAAHTASEAAPRGPLTKLAADWSATLGNTPVAAAELIWLRRLDVPLPARPAGPAIRFVNGDQLAGKAISLANDRLRLAPAFDPSAEWTLSLAALTTIWLDQSADRDQARAIRQRADERRSRDAIWLKNGDVLEGILLGFDAAALTIDVTGKPLKLERNQAAAIGLNTDLARVDVPKGAYAKLILRDGSRLSLGSAQVAGQRLTAKTLLGSSLEVPLDQVVALDMHQGRAVYLSDLQAKAYEEKPYFEGSRWPYRQDRSVAGNDLRLNGYNFDKGIGMHSASRLTYVLDGRYRRFEALVGLDDVTGQRGRATVQVLLDGKPQDLGWSGDLKGGVAPRAIRLNLAGAKELTLVVDYGADLLDVQDHVNWADALLVR